MSFLSKNNLKIFRRKYLKTGGEENPEVWTLLDFFSGKELHSRHNLRSRAAALTIGTSLGEGVPVGSREEELVVLKNPDFSSEAFARVWENLYRSGGIL